MYTVLDENLQVKGRLSLNNGQGSTSFFGDTITTQLATDNANDPAGLTTNDYTNQDKQGNAKQWSHSLTISVEATNLGTSINTTDYLMYFDSVADHYYLMKVINTSTDRNSGFITVSAINAAIYELGKQLIQAEQTLAQVDLKTFVSKMYKNAPFSLRVADDNLTVIDYVVSANTSLQALLQDLQTKYDVDVDSWVEVDNTGRIVDRVLYFGHLGSDNGELVRYGGAKGFENMTATEVSDIIYTKLYVTGKTDDKDAKKGHIGSVNNGMEYIVDDDANQRVYAIGASQQQPSYLEGVITNTLLSEPSALLTWAKQQMSIFNHPRFNYTVSPLHDQIVALGDTVTVQDFHIKPEILVTSKVIQKTVSFASPETNTFVLGEFSSIFTDNMNKSANVINLIKKDVTVVQEAADYAKAQADAAHAQAVLAQEQAIHAQTSADGKTTSYTVDSVQDLPQSANEGDIGWVKLSDGTHMYSYTDGKWVEKINPSMGADIDKKVSDVVTQAKDYSDKAIADNQVKVDASIKSVDDKANQLKQDQSALDTKAQGYANQALSDAKANTAQAVKDVTTNSQKALDQAKTDLTTGIAKEVADRQSAVNALDKTAQGYANQAKSDAISAATTADGVINKKIDDTASSITSTISQNKKDADGKITTAQTTAQQALGSLSTKVSQTDYDTKTGQLQTDLTSTTQTANQAKTDIISIKQKDGDQDARMAQIESDANGVKTTVSSLQTTQGKQSGDISTLQQRADGFDATVTKVNNLSVGGRNLVLGTATDTTWTADSANNYSFNVIKTGLKPGQTYTFSAEVTLGNTDQKITTVSLYDAPIRQWLASTYHFKADGTRDYWTFTVPTTVNTPTASLIIYAGTPGSTGGKSATYHHIKLEQGNLPTDWGPAPEDVDSATAKAQLTADKASLDLSKYQTDVDGRISKAQAGVEANANAITQKVSQTDYDQKTGDLTTAVNTAQSTANSAVTTVGNYQTSNDARVKTAESAILQNANDITLKVAKTDYDKKTGELSGQISEISQTAGKISQSVSDVKTKVDGLSVGGRNLVLGTATDTTWTADSANNYSFNVIKTGLKPGQTYTFSAEVTLGNTDQKITTVSLYDAPIRQWLASTYHFKADGTRDYWTFTVPTTVNTPTASLIIYAGTPGSTGGKSATYHHIKLEQGNLPTDWGPAPEDVDNKISTVSQTVGSISSIVSDPTTGLTKRVQTAEGTLSKVTGTDIPALQKATYWQAPNGYDLNTYLTQGSTFFRDTTARTNAPTTSTKWMYLVVERTPNGDRVTQTAWYDTQTDAKITYRRQYAGTWGPWYANDNDSVTTIAQTNEGIRTEISNRQTGDTNTLSQAKDFTKSSITSSEKNMKSLIDQKADSETLGVIQNDITTLKSNTQWQRIERFDDMNFMTQSGRFFIGASNNTNSAVSASFYIVVDAPQADRITQTQWKDLDGSLMYHRTYNGSSWSSWTQMVMSSTLLNIFHDSWSLGTTTNDGITKQMVTGIMGQPDGTLILKGNSLILDGNTTVTGDFYAKGGNFQNINATNIKFGTLDGYQVNIANVNVNNLVGDTITGFNFNINKQMTIASGGIIKSDVVNMDKDNFTVRAPNINSHRISSEGYTVFTRDGVFNINSGMGAFSSDGNISVAVNSNTDPYKRGIFHSEYGGNNLMMSATGYTNSDPDEFLNMSSARLDYMYSKTGLLSDATQHTSLRANLIETTGTLNAFGVTQTPRVYSWPNLTLESIQRSVVLKAGNQNILQVRENSYVYLLTRHSGSGGSSLQIAGDGALFVQSSASKYKEDIKYDGSTSVGDKFLTLDPATWQDKDEYEQRKLYRETGIEPTHQIHMTDKRYYGLIAEDLVKAGLEEFVVRDEATGEVNGLEYDKVAISLIPVVREQRDAINELRLEVERLKQK